MKLPLKIEPHSHGYVQLYDADNVWIASCKTEHAEIVKAALEAANQQ